MIDFRYHLVSIVAIFLALSVGIVLGTTLLEDPVIKASEGLANQLREGNNELRDQVEALQRREAGNDAFVVADTPGWSRTSSRASVSWSSRRRAPR